MVSIFYTLLISASKKFCNVSLFGRDNIYVETNKLLSIILYHLMTIEKWVYLQQWRISPTSSDFFIHHSSYCIRSDFISYLMSETYPIKTLCETLCAGYTPSSVGFGCKITINFWIAQVVVQKNRHLCLNTQMATE